MSASLLGLVAVFAAVVLAPLITDLFGRIVKVPLVVVEIVLGLLIGPSLLGWVVPGGVTSVLSTLGVAVLFFLAGFEIDYQRIIGRPLVRGALGWVVSLVLGLAVGIGLAAALGSASVFTTGVFIGICLTSTALGTIMPTLRDAGETTTPFGRAVVASGAVGQFGPLLALAVILGGRHPLTSVIALVIFAALVAVGALLASRGLPAPLARIIAATLQSSGQFAVRLVLFVLIGLVGLSVALGLDMLLGAFAAGALARLLLAGTPAPERSSIEQKLEGIGFGFLIPIFFVMTGVTFDLPGLIAQPAALALIPVFLVLFLIVRGIPGSATLPLKSTVPDRFSAILLTSTALAIVVAVANTGVATGALPSTVAAALIGAGMCSVLLFPAIALVLRRRSAADPEAQAAPPLTNTEEPT
jgi:Kef-type K+ transport system membrane component KefB